jgi:REP element-mobilizing transposase RayT
MTMSHLPIKVTPTTRLVTAAEYQSASVWSYCLKPNHVHLILVPSAPECLARAIGETHRRYTGYANARSQVNAHLFQGRFGSVAMDGAAEGGMLPPHTLRRFDLFFCSSGRGSSIK